MNNIFVHAVYFWLKEDITAEGREKFKLGVNSLLDTPGLTFGHVGTPASTDRPVIDRSYSYALLLVFNSQQEHDAYQETDANHQLFISSCKEFWTKVQIFDSIQE